MILTFFILHQRCIFYNLNSRIQVKETYSRLVYSNKKHIDVNRVFSKSIIQNGVSEEVNSIIGIRYYYGIRIEIALM